MIGDFRKIIKEAADKDCSIIGFNIFGYEDAISVVRAAEELNAPVLLMTNKLAVKHMPVEYWGKLLRGIAEDAKVPVSVHLDHTTDYDLVVKAIMSGYTSVMYDGSQLPLEENIKRTKEIVKFAHSCGVFVEAEIGSVAYNDVSNGIKHAYTEPEEAKIFAEQSGADWLAVSIGTLHRMQVQEANIQYNRLEAIQELTDIPLVIHGSTGITDEDLRKLATYQVGKFNVGTALRVAFGETLKEEIEKKPKEFDRLNLFKRPMKMVQEEAKIKMKTVGL